MKHGEGFFRGVRGGKNYYQCWLPESPPKAVLLLVHGLAEHSGHYANLIGYLIPRGYAVYGMDHVGHGKSGGADKLVDPAGARMLHDLVGSTDKTLKVYQGLYHEVYNEPEHEQVLRDVDYWLEAHLASTAYLAPPSTPQGGTEKSPPKGGEGGGRWDVNISPCPSCPSLPRC